MAGYGESIVVTTSTDARNRALVSGRALMVASSRLMEAMHMCME